MAKWLNISINPSIARSRPVPGTTLFISLGKPVHGRGAVKFFAPSRSCSRRVRRLSLNCYVESAS